MIDSPEMASLAAEILKTIAHPVRLRIVMALAESDQQVNALAQLLEVKQPLISQHLKLLRLKGLVDVTRSNGHATSLCC